MKLSKKILNMVVLNRFLLGELVISLLFLTLIEGSGAARNNALTPVIIILFLTVIIEIKILLGQLNPKHDRVIGFFLIALSALTLCWACINYFIILQPLPLLIELIATGMILFSGIGYILNA